jgi:hypothetical protein
MHTVCYLWSALQKHFLRRLASAGQTCKYPRTRAYTRPCTQRRPELHRPWQCRSKCLRALSGPRHAATAPSQLMRRRPRKGKTEATDRKPVFLCSGRYFLCLFVFSLSSVCAAAVGGGGRAFGLFAAGGWGLRRGGDGVRSRPPHCLPAIAPRPRPRKKRGKADDSSRNQKK